MKLRKYVSAMFAALFFTGASVANAAAPIDVTWNPAAAGLTGPGQFTFDNVLINTYGNIDITNGQTQFAEQGFANLVQFSNNGGTTAAPGVGFPGGAPYSLYIMFSATGTQTGGLPSTGMFTSLNFSLLGATGTTTFAANGAGIFSAIGAPTVTLATGSLIGGTTSLTGTPGNLLAASQILTTFVPNSAFAAFFVNPDAFTTLDLNSAFTNTNSVITTSSLGGGDFRLSINGGGGNATFAVTSVPEPDTYGMLLAGLGLFGFIARRRRQQAA